MPPAIVFSLIYDCYPRIVCVNAMSSLLCSWMNQCIHILSVMIPYATDLHAL